MYVCMIIMSNKLVLYLFFQCSDPCNLPTIQYNFVQIGDLANFNADSLVGE